MPRRQACLSPHRSQERRTHAPSLCDAPARHRLLDLPERRLEGAIDRRRDDRRRGDRPEYHQPELHEARQCAVALELSRDRGIMLEAVVAAALDLFRRVVDFAAPPGARGILLQGGEIDAVLHPDTEQPALRPHGAADHDVAAAADLDIGAGFRHLVGRDEKAARRDVVDAGLNPQSADAHARRQHHRDPWIAGPEALPERIEDRAAFQSCRASLHARPYSLSAHIAKCLTSLLLIKMVTTPKRASATGCHPLALALFG